MTKIEIEKPVLPKWMDECIRNWELEYHSISSNKLPKSIWMYNSFHKFLKRKSEFTEEEKTYFYKHEDDFIIAMMYGYEVED